MSATMDSTGLPELSGEQYSALPPTLPNSTGGATSAQMEAAAMKEYNSTPKLQQYIAQQFGYIGTYLSTVPELQPILIAAGVYGWNQAEFDGAVQQTQWWQTTSQSARNFQEIQSTDPAQAAQQISQMQDTILNTAQSLGISVSNNTLQNLSKMAVTYGWGSAQIEQTLRQGNSKATANPQFGASATFADQARQLAGEYGIKLSTTTLGKYVQQNQQGTLTADGLQSSFVKQASALYPWMKTSLDQGITPSQFLSSYASAAGSTLGIDPSSVNWSTPKWTKALLTAKTGSSVNAPVNVGEFQQNLMRTASYGYQNTQGARDAAYSMANTLVSQFGKVAGTT